MNNNFSIFHESSNENQYNNSNVIYLELEDGTEQDCAVIALFSVEELDDQEYIALITVEDLESDDEEGALLLYRYNEDPEDPDIIEVSDKMGCFVFDIANGGNGDGFGVDFAIFTLIPKLTLPEAFFKQRFPHSCIKGFIMIA